MFFKYPYTDMYNMNLDWMIQAIKEVQEIIENLGHVVNTFNERDGDVTLQADDVNGLNINILSKLSASTQITDLSQDQLNSMYENGTRVILGLNNNGRYDRMYVLSRSGTADVTYIEFNAVTDNAVTSFNGQRGNVTGVSSFNGATGAVSGVSSFNGVTGAITGVSSVNGTTGAVNLSADDIPYYPNGTTPISDHVENQLETLADVLYAAIAPIEAKVFPEDGQPGSFLQLDNDGIPVWGGSPYIVIDPTLSVSGEAADAKATGDGINDVKNTIHDITESTRNLFDDDTKVTGSLTSTGVINSDEFNWTSDYIDVEGEPFVVSWETNPTDNYLRIGFYNASKVFDHRDLISLTDTQKYKSIPNANSFRYIRISLNIYTTDVQVEIGNAPTEYIQHLTAVDTTARAVINEVENSLSGRIDSVDADIANLTGRIVMNDIDTTENVYINYATGDTGTFTAAPYTASDYIDIETLAGVNAYFKAVFNGVTGIAFYDSLKTYISGVGPSDAGGSSMTPAVVAVDIPANAKYARLTISLSGDINDFPIVYNGTLVKTDRRVTTLENKENDYILLSHMSAFEHFGVIGDSYASGEIVVDNIYTDYYNLSWGQNLARICGTTCINFSKGGLTTKTWLTDAKGLPLLLTENAQNLYLICLGLNDHTRIAQGTYSLGTAADLTNDYTQNPDTFYGNYGRIIGNIMNYAPNAKIIICTVTEGIEGDFADVNGAIPVIANHYNLPLMRLQDDPFFKSAFYRASMVASHPTALSYAGYAQGILRLFSKCAVTYVNYFKNYVG